MQIHKLKTLAADLLLTKVDLHVYLCEELHIQFKKLTF